jgi:hypothetical protein
MSNENLQLMVEHVFSEPAKGPNYYLLDLEVKREMYPDKTEVELKDMESANIAQILMSIFSHGCSIIFKGEKITGRDMTAEHFVKMDKYIQSFGYKTNYLVFKAWMS